ncbi:MAG: Stp1/IreP family PP2C-type Ser/Thr phosphatase, partial [Coriobacteriaceae bacterium]|nr:Stp1/IreP family PP2C-type Ser/Thr phosphatase [Coriobacteriaceae bacterium]
MAAGPTYRTDRIVPEKRRAAASFGSRTDIGCLRKDNEDSLVVADPLFAVADGMGGHDSGEVASEIAIRTLLEFAPDYADGEVLGTAVVEANRAVLQAVADGTGKPGMGTTMTAAVLEGERLVIAHVGDSRAYLFYQGKLQQITRDHSLMADMIEAGQLTVEEARVHPSRSIITRALGSDPNVLPDIYEINVETGDRLLICTDGLSGMLTDDLIEKELLQEPDPQLCANNLVNAALAAGGHDNVTVVVAEVSGLSEPRQEKSVRRAKVSAAFIVLAFFMVLAVAIGGFYYYTQNSFYLAENNGRVAVYRGLPGSLFGIRISDLESMTDIKVESLQPGVANRLQEGIRVDDLDRAQELIAEYRDSTRSAATPERDPSGG